MNIKNIILKFITYIIINILLLLCHQIVFRTIYPHIVWFTIIIHIIFIIYFPYINFFKNKTKQNNENNN